MHGHGDRVLHLAKSKKEKETRLGFLSNDAQFLAVGACDKPINACAERRQVHRNAVENRLICGINQLPQRIIEPDVVVLLRRRGPSNGDTTRRRIGVSHEGMNWWASGAGRGTLQQAGPK